MADHQLIISNPLTYNGRKVISYQVFYGFGREVWRNNRAFEIERWPDKKTWNVLERKIIYGANGMTERRETIYYGKDLSLRDARKLCMKQVEKHIAAVKKAG